MKFLQISVCMFATIVVTCFYTRNYFYHHLYLLMVIFGILNHGLERKNDNSKNIIHIIDTSLAHFAFFYCGYESIHVRYMNISLFNIFVLFLLEYKFPKHDHILHFFIHLQTTISMNIYFIYDYNKTPIDSKRICV
jgi:hypothetical protein